MEELKAQRSGSLRIAKTLQKQKRKFVVFMYKFSLLIGEPEIGFQSFLDTH